MPKIEPDSKWRHYSGRIYTVVVVANESGTNNIMYPVIVVYQGKNGSVWAKSRVKFLETMKPA